MQLKREHDANCPLGVNGLRAYWEALDQLNWHRPDEMTMQHYRSVVAAEIRELEEKQRCTCGVK